MFTNQKLLGVLLILFILGGTGYFVINKFKQEVSKASTTSSPTPQALDFLFNTASTPTPLPLGGQQAKQQVKSVPIPQPTELPLAKNKALTQFPGMLTAESLQNKKAVIQTAKGIIQIQIYPEAPIAASNFMILGANGFYNGLTFHRVEDWVIQGGDPLGNGTGGPGYQFPDEPVNRAYVKGVVAMANAGPDTNGSQFFILKTDYPLQPAYTIFGAVISGMDIVEKIAPGDVMQKVTVQNLQ